MKKYLIALAALLLAVSCDQFPGIGGNSGTDQSQSLVVDAEATTKTVKFTTTSTWEAKASQNWVTATPGSGAAGTHEVLLEIQVNTATSSREAVVTISMTDGISADITFTITQKAANAGGNEGGNGGGENEGGEGNGGNEGEGGDEGEGGNEGGDDHGYGKGEDFGGNFD